MIRVIAGHEAARPNSFGLVILSILQSKSTQVFSMSCTYKSQSHLYSHLVQLQLLTIDEALT
jgi:hypothetical protein